MRKRESYHSPFFLLLSQQICPQNRANLPKISLSSSKQVSKRVIKKMKRAKSRHLRAHQKHQRSNKRRETFPPQNKKNRSSQKTTTQNFCSRKTKVRDERFIYYIYTKFSLSVCVSLSRSRTRIHRVFFIPSFYSLLFPICVLDYSSYL